MKGLTGFWSKRKFLGFAGACAASVLTSAKAQEDYPTRPVRIIVPFPAGGNFDRVFRVLSANAALRLSQSILVDNRPGAGGIIGIASGAKSAPDGYTFVGVANSFSVNPSIRTDMPYKQTDLTPVILIGATPLVLLASPELSGKVSSLPELLSYARSLGKPLTYGSFGAATTPHLAMEMLRLRENLPVIHIPYKGESQAVTDLQASTIDLVFSNLPTALPHVKAGRMKILAMGTSKRSSIAPEIATVAEQIGFKDFSFDSWYGLMAPAGTPQQRIAKLYRTLADTLEDRQVRDELLGAGIELSGIGEKDFGEFLQSQMRMYADIIRDAHIVVNP